MARCGSRNRPPSEKLSGVTLRMPMIAGRPWTSSRATGAGAGRGVKALAALRWRAYSLSPASVLIADLQGKLLGVLDPAHHELLGREKPDQLLLFVGLRHGLRQ